MRSTVTPMPGTVIRFHFNGAVAAAGTTIMRGRRTPTDPIKLEKAR